MASNPDREWLSYEDPSEHRTWLFDVTFLMSNWTTAALGLLPNPLLQPNWDAALMVPTSLMMTTFTMSEASSNV